MKTSGLVEAFQEALEVLDESPFVEKFALMGNLALSVSFSQVFSTLDVDFLAAGDAGKFAEELSGKGFGVFLMELPDGDALVRFWREEKKVPVDAFFCEKEWKRSLLERCVEVNFRGRAVKVLNREALFLLKAVFLRGARDAAVLWEMAERGVNPEDLEDACLAEAAYERFLASGENPVPLEEVERELGLEKSDPSESSGPGAVKVKKLRGTWKDERKHLEELASGFSPEERLQLALELGDPVWELLRGSGKVPTDEDLKHLDWRERVFGRSKK